MPIDHTAFYIPRAKFAASVDFYMKALELFNYQKVMDIPDRVVGLGDPNPNFWIAPTDAESAQFHVAFVAKDHDEVKKFHENALAAGGKDEGAPGYREMYGPNYYAAFVKDPAGNTIEAVCRSEQK